MMTLQQARDLLATRGVASVMFGDGHARFHRVHTDTRSLQEGDFFVALAGENFDANDFLPQAKTQGAAAALAQRGLGNAGLSGLHVADTKQALGHLAAAWRSQCNVNLIAVTGSNGKTTVTQMLASILRADQGAQALATQGNLNNDIGVPLTLLRLRAEHRIAVIELGMNHPGEIALLASMTQANVALVNNAQREHQEFMSTVLAVAQENGAAISALPANGVAVFPADDAYTSVWRALADTRRCITFALSGKADVTAHCEWDSSGEGVWRVQAATPFGALGFTLAIAGRHNVKNALAAVASALAAGIALPAIARGLESFEAVKGRSRVSTLGLPTPQGTRRISLIDDTYNANPDSVRAAIDVLADLPGPHLLVLGDMGEVGDQGPEFHAEVGEYAAQRGIESLLCMGEQMRYGAAVFPGARHFGGCEALCAAAVQELADYRSVLVKGSRFMKMERVVLALQTRTKEVSHAA